MKLKEKWWNCSNSRNK